MLRELRQHEQPALDEYLRQLDPGVHPATHALEGALRDVDRDTEFDLGLDLLLGGVLDSGR